MDARIWEELQTQIDGYCLKGLKWSPGQKTNFKHYHKLNYNAFNVQLFGIYQKKIIENHSKLSLLLSYSLLLIIRSV